MIGLQAPTRPVLGPWESLARPLTSHCAHCWSLRWMRELEAHSPADRVVHLRCRAGAGCRENVPPTATAEPVSLSAPPVAVDQRTPLWLPLQMGKVIA